jgi:hypothetical protein
VDYIESAYVPLLCTCKVIKPYTPEDNSGCIPLILDEMVIVIISNEKLPNNRCMCLSNRLKRKGIGKVNRGATMDSFRARTHSFIITFGTCQNQTMRIENIITVTKVTIDTGMEKLFKLKA